MSKQKNNKKAAAENAVAVKQFGYVEAKTEVTAEAKNQTEAQLKAKIENDRKNTFADNIRQSMPIENKVATEKMLTAAAAEVIDVDKAEYAEFLAYKAKQATKQATTSNRFERDFAVYDCIAKNTSNGGTSFTKLIPAVQNLFVAKNPDKPKYKNAGLNRQKSVCRRIVKFMLHAKIAEYKNGNLYITDYITAKVAADKAAAEAKTEAKTEAK